MWASCFSFTPNDITCSLSIQAWIAEKPCILPSPTDHKAKPWPLEASHRLWSAWGRASGSEVKWHRAAESTQWLHRAGGLIPQETSALLFNSTLKVLPGRQQRVDHSYHVQWDFFFQDISLLDGSAYFCFGQVTPSACSLRPHVYGFRNWSQAKWLEAQPYVLNIKAEPLSQKQSGHQGQGTPWNGDRRAPCSVTALGLCFSSIVL